MDVVWREVGSGNGRGSEFFFFKKVGAWLLGSRPAVLAGEKIYISVGWN